MEQSNTTYACEKCGKQRTEADGNFTDQDMKKFCCEKCCKTEQPAEADKPAVCEFC